MVVDDEPDLVELVAFNLKAEGYEVITASTGVEALNQARSALPDLIVLDLMLPELDGLAVCEILHRLPSTALIPIIMVTAWSSENSRVIGLETGAEDYMTKPFSPRELVLRVRNMLRAYAEKAAGLGGTV
ncbi:MAG: histidine kinase [Pedosphaera sp.]|nr:histidine kinase [Pedosphaera sp.]